MNEKTWDIIQQITTYAIIPVLTALGTWGVQQIKLASSRIRGERLQKMKLIAQLAVESTEQVMAAADGEEKKKYSLCVATRLLDKQRIIDDTNLMDDLIEAQVWARLNAPAVIKTANTTEAKG